MHFVVVVVVLKSGGCWFTCQITKRYQNNKTLELLFDLKNENNSDNKPFPNQSNLSKNSKESQKCHCLFNFITIKFHSFENGLRVVSVTYQISS
jgi:hypothetical protein